MIIKKGTKLYVKHQRKGRFYGEAYEDFDTEKDEWYPIQAAEHIEGESSYWTPGEEVPCRNILTEVSLAESKE